MDHPTQHRRARGGSWTARLVVASSILCAMGCDASGDASVDGTPLDGLASALEPGTVLVLGEIHGTVEAPALVARVVDRALERGLAVTVALELPVQERDRLAAFHASAGTPEDRQALLSGPFWRSDIQDGRGSAAMVDLLDALRLRARDGSPVGVVPIDRRGRSASEREQAMAEALAEAVSDAPGTVTISLVGNVHARLARGAPGVSDPMALRVAALLPDTRVVAVELAHAGGTAWVCTSRGGCGASTFAGDEPSGTTIADAPGPRGFHGVVGLGTIRASPPAADPHAGTDLLPPTGIVTHREPRTIAPHPRLAEAPLLPTGDWPRWLGPGGSGSVEPGLLGRGVAATLEIDWVRPVGPGYSSITVSAGRAFTLEARDETIWLLALATSDGTELWRSPLVLPDDPEVRDESGGPLSTPAVDGGRVYAIHPTGRLFAFAVEDGTRLWSRDLVAELGATLPSFGMSTSPIPDGERVLVLVGGPGGDNLVVFSAASGEVLRSLGHARQGSYATPVLAKREGQRQVVVAAGDRLYAVHLGTGGLLWSHEGLPYPDRDPVVLPGNRVLVAFQEFVTMLEVSAGGTARELWRSERLRSSYSLAVHHEGAVYGFEGDRLTCLAADGGRMRWQHRFGDGTMIRVDDHLVVLGATSGRLHLVAADPRQYTETTAVTVFPHGHSRPTAPSLGDGRIFVRGTSEIAAVRLGRGD